MSNNPAGLSRSLRRIAETETHHRLLVSFIVAAATLGGTIWFLPLWIAMIASWNAFAFSSLTLAWLGMFLTDARTRVKEAHLQDSHRSTIFSCIVAASFAGLVGACFLLSSAKTAGGSEAIRHVALAASTVISSWLLVHTMLSLHYAHVYYCDCDESETSSATGGLSFPGDEAPEFLDFAYFSFVIGMTFQVSDVEVTSQTIRRLVLFHGLLSFAFNTVIVAFSINLASTLL